MSWLTPPRNTTCIRSTRNRQRVIDIAEDPVRGGYKPNRPEQLEEQLNIKQLSLLRGNQNDEIRAHLSIMVTGSSVLLLCPECGAGREPGQLFGQYSWTVILGNAAVSISVRSWGREFDNLVFENITPQRCRRMWIPSEAERSKMLSWLASQQPEPNQTRSEAQQAQFVHSVNDLLGTKLDLAAQIRIRGTRHLIRPTHWTQSRNAHQLLRSRG